MIDLEETQQAAEEAYQAAKAGFELFGEELRPYSPSRKVAAQKMGMLYPMVGEQGADQMQRTGTYPGFLNDVIILTWLCSLPDFVGNDADGKPTLCATGSWTPSSALRKPHEAMQAAMDWADSKGFIEMNSKQFEEASSVFAAIANGISASEYRVQIEGAHGGTEASPKV